MGRTAEVVAGFLKVEEAEMLTELLASEGIDAWFEGAVASCLGPLIPGAGGGAKLLVPPDDAGRARSLIAASGLFRAEGAAGDGPADPAPRQDEAPTGRVTFALYPVAVALLVLGATVLRYLAGR